MKANTLVRVLPLLLAMGASTAYADHGASVLGAAIGSAAGAAVGHGLGGDRGAVIVWSALGGAAGAAIGQSMDWDDEPRSVIYRPRYVRERVIYVPQPAERCLVVPPPRRVVYVYGPPPGWRKHHHAHWDWDD
ncbi:glycine zipper domain-containing protein [Thiobacter aerophilum]|uniref:Glycine zipper domain-containing protein n=1 Tax=Thiobacter aerophilum TaxID=3121275 RepID=A0ABV0EE30_9BURK